MHGRKREPKELKYREDRVAARKKKAGLYAQLSDEVFRRRREGRRDAESLALSAKLLELNSELYSLWHYRKEALQEALDADSGPEGEGKKLVQAELKLIEGALAKNPKSYGAWQHRKWVISNKHLVDLQRELDLCGLMLTADERNFHCWSYRRYVAKVMDRDPEDELDFTTEKIQQNFSNYSAWHYRSSLLPRVHQTTSFVDLASASPGSPEVKQRFVVPPAKLDDEFGLVKQAFFTEPEDSSAWLYHRWLVGHVMATQGEAACANVLEREAAVCRDLLEVEPGCKWPMLTLAQLLERRERLKAGEGGEASAKVGNEESRGIFGDLVNTDPMRREYYEDVLAGKAAVA